VFNILIFFGVAVTNGLIVFFVGALSSCLSSAWMLTAFLVRPARRGKSLALPLKVVLVAVGIVALVGFTYAHPIYLATVVGVVIHEMRVLDRYDLGPIAAISAPVVSILPLVPTSHASYSQLTLSSETAAFEPLVGYLLVTVLLVVVIVLIKKDDRELLPLVGKTDEQFAFETVGVPNWMRKLFGIDKEDM
jgi:hypothetical protein